MTDAAQTTNAITDLTGLGSAGLWQPPSVAHLQDVLAHYEVLDFLGRGGMGAVYKARQRSLNREVAIKILPANARHSVIDFVERFKLEARAMARLNHPAIVAVHDFGESAEGQLFIVMELIEGGDLAGKIEKEGRLPMGEALRIAGRVCEALEYAHSRGVIHRDIKPANILVARDGTIKVTDFGLAKLEDPLLTNALTHSNTTLGSQDFAAPELFAKGKDADHRADIYSLGVMLYQMLTGDVPRGMFKMPSEKLPGLDPRLDALICKAMEEDREDRFQCAGEMREALAAVRTPLISPVAGGHEAATRATARKRSSPFRSIALGSAVAAVVLGAAVWMSIEKKAPPISSAPAPVPPTEWVDVMAMVDTSRDVAVGRWKILDGTLTNIAESGNSLVKLPITPAGAYELRLQLRRVSEAGGYVAIAFRFQDHAAAFLIDDSPLPHAGIASIDGKTIATNGAGVTGTTPFLPAGVTVEVVLMVCHEGLVVTINGAQVYRWKGDWSRVSHDGPGLLTTLEGQPAMAIGCYNGRIAIHAIELREIGDGNATGLPAVSTGAEKAPPASDAELRQLARWLFSLPVSEDPAHAETKVPDLLLQNATRNLRKVSELPAAPLSIGRIRIGPLRMDAENEKHLEILSRVYDLNDLRIYGAENAATLAYVRNLRRLGTLSFNALAGTPRLLPDEQLKSLEHLDRLSRLRLENWIGLTGQGLSHLKEKGRITTLTFNGCPDINDAGLREVARFTHLKILGLEGGRAMTDAGIAHLRTLRDLELLGLDGSFEGTLTDASFAPLAALPHLKVVHLGSRFAGSATRHLARLTQLEEVHGMRNPAIRDTDLAALARLPKLCRLRLTDTSVNGAGFAAFAGTSRIKNLDIEDCPISADGIRTIVQALPGLETLVISRNQTGLSTAVMVEALSGLPNLHHGYFSYKITNADMPLIATLTRLGVISLESSDVTDAGIPHLQSLPSLTDLTLTGLKLTDACIPALKELQTLTALNVTGTQITPRGLADIKRALPACKVTP